MHSLSSLKSYSRMCSAALFSIQPSLVIWGGGVESGWRPLSEFLDPDWGDKVNSGLWLPYWPARLHGTVVRNDNPMPELTLSPSSGIYEFGNIVHILQDFYRRGRKRSKHSFSSIKIFSRMCSAAYSLKFSTLPPLTCTQCLQCVAGKKGVGLCWTFTLCMWP